MLAKSFLFRTQRLLRFAHRPKRIPQRFEATSFDNRPRVQHNLLQILLACICLVCRRLCCRCRAWCRCRRLARLASPLCSRRQRHHGLELFTCVITVFISDCRPSLVWDGGSSSCDTCMTDSGAGAENLVIEKDVDGFSDVVARLLKLEDWSD